MSLFEEGRTRTRLPVAATRLNVHGAYDRAHGVLSFVFTRLPAPFTICAKFLAGPSPTPHFYRFVPVSVSATVPSPEPVSVLVPVPVPVSMPFAGLGAVAAYFGFDVWWVWWQQVRWVFTTPWGRAALVVSVCQKSSTQRHLPVGTSFLTAESYSSSSLSCTYAKILQWFLHRCGIL